MKSLIKAEYTRNLGFISEAEQTRLNNSSVAIAGAGGDGGMLAIQLARLGVGEIRLADPESFDLENINRQARATTKTIGLNKAVTVGEYITEINPEIKVTIFEDGITHENVDDFVEGTNLVIDETEFTLHALGTALARSARLKNIPNLMATNIGFGATVTTFHPQGKTYERILGLDEEAPIDEIAQQEVSIERWLPYVPSYGDLDVLAAVASGEKSAPSIAPGVNLASSIGATQSFLNLVHDLGNNRPKPVYAPSFMAMDAMNGESRIIKYPRLSTKLQLARLAFKNFTKQVPKASYT